MAIDPPSQPYHLTLIELAFNYALFGGIGYWVAGVVGALVGSGLLTARYAYLIWVAVNSPQMGRSSAESIRRPSEETRL